MGEREEGAGDASSGTTDRPPLSSAENKAEPEPEEFCRPCGKRNVTERHFKSRRHANNLHVQDLRTKLEEECSIAGMSVLVTSADKEKNVTIEEDGEKGKTRVNVDVEELRKASTPLSLILTLVQDREDTNHYTMGPASFLGTVESTLTNKDTPSMFRAHTVDTHMENGVGALKLECDVPKDQSGVYINPVEVELIKTDSDTGDKVGLKLYRQMEVVVFSRMETQLGPAAPFVPKKWQFSKAILPSFRENQNIVRGSPSIFFPPDGRNELEERMRLLPFSVPLSLRMLAARNFKLPPPDKEVTRIPPVVRREEGRVRDLLAATLHPHNYAHKFKLLMHLEELQQEVSIREYDMEKVKLRRVRGLGLDVYEMRVPGLAESRPSLLRGDRVFAWAQHGPDYLQYEGYVCEVREETVLMGFPAQLRRAFGAEKEWGMRFTVNRMPLKLMQRAVHLSQELSLSSLLFPVKTNKNLAKDDEVLSLELFDKKLEDNPEQMEAVERVVRGAHSPAPYVIFGPPGTGKTVTVVEAIKQILKVESRSRVLACAPSNAAADLLCQRLLKHVHSGEILRLNAISRSAASCSEEVMGVSNWNEYYGGFYLPAKEALHKSRVIIATLTTAGRLASAQLTPGFFSHIWTATLPLQQWGHFPSNVFVDEAGQATEPESVAGIAGLVDVGVEGERRKTRKGHVILAGDPEQLGPVLHSLTALEHGLGRSLLERLMTETELYRKQGNGTYDRKFLTKLVRNYRSHPEILSVPSRLFYDGELKACADKRKREAVASWDFLPAKGVPLVFHGVVGKDMREGNSPSFFNPAEIATLKDYIDRMMETAGVKDVDIGIIAPYRKQVEKVRELLREDLKKYGGISVGSVEEFQGAERRVILISTVRSNPHFLSVDAQFKLGFLANPKRFNTAITRAKALLIIVGNPWVLQKDPHWKQMLGYCKEKGACRGIDFHLDEEEEEEEDSSEGDSEDTLEEGEIRDDPIITSTSSIILKPQDTEA